MHVSPHHGLPVGLGTTELEARNAARDPTDSEAGIALLSTGKGEQKTSHEWQTTTSEAGMHTTVSVSQSIITLCTREMKSYSNP